jgi:hypothetical protein
MNDVSVKRTRRSPMIAPASDSSARLTLNAVASDMT